MKKHFEENKKFYIGIACGVALAGITWLIMRDRSSLVRITIGDPAQRTIGVLGDRVTIKNSTLNTVSYVSADRQGPPSWIVRCNETGDIFLSQRAAATSMGLSQDHLSNHLNGSRDHVDGYTFERIAMAA